MTWQTPSDAHARDAADVLASLDADRDAGLTSEEAARRLEACGPNRLDAGGGRPWWRMLWDQVASAVVVLLLGAAVLGFVAGEVVEAAAVMVVLAANTVVGFLTERQASRSMAALRHLTPAIAEVTRDGRRTEVEAAELVPGDLVGVEAGERVPADLRVLAAEGLAVDEAALTGESAQAAKDVDGVDADAPLAERTSMLYSGTTVGAGRGVGVVVATGGDTEVGRVAALAGGTEQTQAPLQQGLARLSGQLAVAVVGIAGALVALGLARGLDTTEVLEIAIALAIAIVPEGLPAVATLTLAVGMRRMARRKALVRRLPAVETLGSTTVVCSDKTGTLTANEMEVVDLVSAEGVEPSELWTSAVLCNDADVDPDGEPVGDPTEVALLRGAEGQDCDWRALRERHPRSREVPFDSSSMRMATVTGDEVHVKGAPEVLLQPGSPLHRAAEDMAGRALRTLAVARRADPGDEAADDELFEDLQVLGVVGMLDPPREEAVRAVEELRTAGIRLVMITGDRADTAGAVADRLGLDTATVVGGDEVDGRRTGGAGEGGAGGGSTRLAESADVFARVTPEHKLDIVASLQDAGEVVAVTGDGVNDAPALSKADVGVAMGAGTDVAKEAADIVLLDDDVSTIVAAVEEGRRVFENIRRFAQFLFSWHFAEVLVIAAAIAAGAPPPLAGLMILWNNLVIDVLPSFALALEPAAGDVMRAPPRPPGEPVITRGLLRRVAVQGLWVAGVGLVAFAIARGRDLELEQARTMVFVTMSAAQILSVFNARGTGGSGFRGATANPWLWVALGVSLALEAAALGIPALRDLLGLATLPGDAWLTSGLLGLLPLAAIQTWRIARGRLRGGAARQDR